MPSRRRSRSAASWPSGWRGCTQPLVDLSRPATPTSEQMREAYEALHAGVRAAPGLQVAPVNAGGVHALSLTTEADRPTDDPLPARRRLRPWGRRSGIARWPARSPPRREPVCWTPGTGSRPSTGSPPRSTTPLRAYEWLLERGTPAPRSGDARGRLDGRRAGDVGAHRRQPSAACRCPGGAVLMCPAVDLSLEPPRGARRRRPQAAIQLITMGWSSKSYLGDAPLDDPLISPLQADLAGLPPLLVQGATGDHQRPRANALVDRARSQGVDARLELYPVDTHVFQFFWSFLPEGSRRGRARGRVRSPDRRRAMASSREGQMALRRLDHRPG